MPKAKLGHLSLEDLQREIARRKKALPKLEKRRKKLLAALADLDEQMAQWQGAPAAKVSRRRVKRGRRSKNEVSLTDRLITALKGGRAMSISDLMAAAMKAGHKTTSKNFRLLVNQTLSRGKMFRGAGRGKYALKAQRKSKPGKMAVPAAQ